jgi:hypothetical protein
MFSAVLFVFLSAAGQAASSDIIPQARPVAAMLQAVRDGNQDQLKTVFSESMRRTFDSEGWDKVLRIYQEGFKKEFGEYRSADFSYQFAGGENKGTVLIIFKGKTLPGLQVIKEGTEWKVDER